MWVHIQDLITCATFGYNRLRGLGVATGQISRFPIDLRRRPYKTPVRVRGMNENCLINFNQKVNCGSEFQTDGAESTTGKVVNCW